MRYFILLLVLGLTACRSGTQGRAKNDAAVAMKATAVDLAATRATSVGSLATGGVPVNNASNLFGVYVVGRGSQVFSWTQPIHEDQSVNTNYSGYRLYWWTVGSTVTNYVDLTKDVQKVLMSGVAGANKPLTFLSLTVLNGSLEGQASNTLLVPTEP